jgi:small subunit ribosomal protein S6
MENVKTNSAYECMFVSDLTGARDAAETVAKFVGLVEKNGEIIDVTEWGKRRFEYPINDKNEGYYTIVTFRAEPSFPAEFERLLNIDENVMRSFIIKLDEEEVAKVIRRAADKAAAATAAPVEAVVEEAAAEEAVAEEAPAADAE